MRPDLGSLFEDDDFKLFVNLLELDCGRKARWPAPDNHNIARHRFTFDCFVAHKALVPGKFGVQRSIMP